MAGREPAPELPALGVEVDHDLREEVRLAEHLVHQQPQVGDLVVVDADEDRAGVGQHPRAGLQPRPHHRRSTPCVPAVDAEVVAVGEVVAGVVRRVDVDQVVRRRGQRRQHVEVVALGEGVPRTARHATHHAARECEAGRDVGRDPATGMPTARRCAELVVRLPAAATPARWLLVADSEPSTPRRPACAAPAVAGYAGDRRRRRRPARRRTPTTRTHLADLRPGARARSRRRSMPGQRVVLSTDPALHLRGRRPGVTVTAVGRRRTQRGPVALLRDAGQVERAGHHDRLRAAASAVRRRADRHRHAVATTERGGRHQRRLLRHLATPVRRSASATTAGGVLLQRDRRRLEQRALGQHARASGTSASCRWWREVVRPPGIVVTNYNSPRVKIGGTGIYDWRFGRAAGYGWTDGQRRQVRRVRSSTAWWSATARSSPSGTGIKGTLPDRAGATGRGQARRH